MPLFNIKNVCWTALLNAGVEWATSLLDWMKRIPITINGASKTPTLSDDFTSYADTTAGDLAYPTTSTTKVRVNPTNDNIDFDFDDDTTQRIYHDLQNELGAGVTLDTRFIIRGKFSFSTLTDAGGNTRMFFGIGSDTGDKNEANSIQLEYRHNNPLMRLAYGEGSLGSSDSMSALTTSTNYFWQIIRTSTTTVDISISSTDAYDGDLAIVIGGTITAQADLRYVKLMSNSSTTQGAFTGTLDDITVYNGVTVVENIPSQQTADAVFGASADQIIENFETYSSNINSSWVPQGAPNIGNESTNKLDFETTRGTTAGNDNCIYDLGSALGDQFTLRFKATISDSDLASGSDQALTFGLWSASGTTIGTNSQDQIGFAFFYDTSNVDFKSSLADNASLQTAYSAGTSFDITIANQDYYFEIVRNGSNVIYNIYSDASYSILIESEVETISGTISGLQYLGFKNVSTGGTITGGVDGTIDDIELWDLELNPATLTDYPLPVKIIGNTDLQRRTTPNREDLFGSVGSWTQAVGTAVDITGGALTATSVNMATHDRLHDAIDVTLSDSLWRADFKVNISEIQDSDQVCLLGFCDTIGTISNNDAIVFTTKGLKMQLFSYAGGSYQSETTGITIVLDTDYWITITRDSTTKVTHSIYRDSARTILLGTETHTTLATVGGLDVIQSGGSNWSAGTASYTIDNLRIWNGITNPVDQEVATFTDDLTADNGWTKVGSAISYVSAKIDANFIGDSSSHSLIMDFQDADWLGENPSDQFVFRMKADTVAAAGVGAAAHGIFGFQTTTDDEFTSNNRDFFLAEYLFGSDDQVRMRMGTATTPSAPDNSTTYSVIDALTVETRYVEFIRNRDVFTINFFSDSSYSILTDTETITEVGLGDLRYFVFMVRDSNTVSDTGAIDFDDMEFWNGVTSPNASGRKFVFTDNQFNGDAVEYSSEMESYDPINGDWIGTVRIPSLTAGADTTIQMYHNYLPTNPSYEPELMPSPTPAEGVWGSSGIDVIETFAGDTSHTANDTVDNWTTTDYSKILFNGEDHDMSFTEDSSSQDDIMYIDIGTANISTKFIFRCRWELTAFTTHSTSGNNHKQEIGFCAGFGLGEDPNEDMIGIQIINFQIDGKLQFYVFSRDGTTRTYTVAYGIPQAEVVPDNFYLEVIRNGDVATLNVYSDPSYSILLGTASQTQTGITGLRYFEQHLYTQATNGETTGNLDDIQFWNGISSFEREKTTYDSNYKAVYNLQGNSIDSTRFGNDGVKQNADTIYETQNNSVGATFDGSNDGITVSGDTSLDGIWDGGGHMSAWINPKSDGEGSAGAIVRRLGSSIGWFSSVHSESSGIMKVRFLQEFSSNYGFWTTTNTVVPINEVTKIDIFYNSDSTSNIPTILINGISVDITVTQSPTGTRDLGGVGEAMEIGHSGSGVETFDGFIDNVKISDKSRPSSEAITSYNAEKSDQDTTTSGTQAEQ